MIKAEIVAHSKNYQGDELISFLVTFPRIILPEVLTHRMFSRNTSSSRAIPFEKMVEVVENNPFIPVAFQKKHKGMQGYEYLSETNDEISEYIMAKGVWLSARDRVVASAKSLYKDTDEVGFPSVTKQLCNRLLEPFSWTKMLITTSKEGLDNFFDLRCPNYNGCKSWKELCNMDSNYTMETSILERLKISKSTAEIHIQLLAESMYDAYNESKAEEILPAEWHIPFIKQISEEYPEADMNDKIKIATSMAARVSYTTIEEGKKISIEKHRELYQLLIDEKHSSPLEHCAKALFYFDYEDFVRKELPAELINEDSLTNQGWCDNFKGFMPLRRVLKS